MWRLEYRDGSCPYFQNMDFETKRDAEQTVYLSGTCITEYTIRELTRAELWEKTKKHLRDYRKVMREKDPSHFGEFNYIEFHKNLFRDYFEAWKKSLEKNPIGS